MQWDARLEASGNEREGKFVFDGELAIFLFSQLVIARLPVGPKGRPVSADEIRLGCWPKLPQRIKFALRQFLIAPLETGFGKSDPVFGIIRCEFDAALEMFARLALTADAPARRMMIKLPQETIRASIIKILVELARFLEAAFHFADQRQRTQKFGPRQLTEI